VEAALLMHALDWKLAGSELELNGGVKLCATQGSDVERLYLELCASQNVDAGEPFDYRCHARFSVSMDDDGFWEWGGPWSQVAQLVTTVNLCTEAPVGMCRLLLSKDGFKTAVFPSEVIYEHNPHLEFLQVDPSTLQPDASGAFILREWRFASIDQATATGIDRCWTTFRALSQADGFDNHRVKNALSYMFYAWRSYYLDHVCLNLSVVLESLFAPASTGELTHQIAFNVSRFSESTADGRQNVYRLVKQFYGTRSRIVHGGQPKSQVLYQYTPAAYWLCVRVLRTILEDENLARQFCHEQERRAMVESWIFG